MKNMLKKWDNVIKKCLNFGMGWLYEPSHKQKAIYYEKICVEHLILVAVSVFCV